MPGHPPVPLPGYYVAEIVITPGSPAAGRQLGDVGWPTASVPVRWHGPKIATIKFHNKSVSQ
jgi:hypothetical protein